MLALVGGAFFLLLLFLVPEAIGITSPAEEDTLSEVVFDWPLWATLLTSALFALFGGLAVWAAGHFIEGWIRRRKKERE